MNPEHQINKRLREAAIAAFYNVMTGGAMVTIDDWTTPIDEVWESYVVYPAPSRRSK